MYFVGDEDTSCSNIFEKMSMTSIIYYKFLWIQFSLPSSPFPPPSPVDYLCFLHRPHEMIEYLCYSIRVCLLWPVSRWNSIKCCFSETFRCNWFFVSVVDVDGTVFAETARNFDWDETWKHKRIFRHTSTELDFSEIALVHGIVCVNFNPLEWSDGSENICVKYSLFLLTSGNIRTHLSCFNR